MMTVSHAHQTKKKFFFRQQRRKVAPNLYRRNQTQHDALRESGDNKVHADKRVCVMSEMPCPLSLLSFSLLRKSLLWH